MLSIVIPVFDESPSLAELHRELDVILDTICVDDTDFVLDQSCSRNPVIRKKRLEAVTAIGAAYRAILRGDTTKRKAR